MKIDRHSIGDCTTYFDPKGKFVFVPDLIRLLEWLEDNDDPKVILAKITLTIEELK